jgi:hypothetical protein
VPAGDGDGGSVRLGTAGLVVGAAVALKLIAWPVAVVLAVHAATHGRRPLVRFGLGAAGVPVRTLLPALLAGPRAVLENTVLFPLGLGLVSSPAGAPLPGNLVASQLPGGKAIAIGLLAAMGLMPATRFGYLL